MSDGKIPEEHVQELAGCFAACAPGLFRYACILTGGDSALAGDVVAAERKLGEAQDLAATLAKASAAGVKVLSAPRKLSDRISAIRDSSPRRSSR